MSDLMTIAIRVLITSIVLGGFSIFSIRTGMKRDNIVIMFFGVLGAMGAYLFLLASIVMFILIK